MTTEQTATIKRMPSGIEGLLERHTAQAPEEAHRLEVTEGGAEYQPLLAKLEEFLDCPNTKKAEEAVLDSIKDILAPERINTFLQTAVTLENHPEYLERTGRFISRLIQNSYDAGHNDFELDLRNLKEIHNLGSYLAGAEENPIRITIKEKTGNCCGYEAEHCTFNTEETGNVFGLGAKHCTFNAEKTEHLCGFLAEHCTFNTQETGNKCGDGANNCTFKTTNPETFAQMLESVQRKYGNKVVFIRKDGSEEVRE